MKSAVGARVSAVAERLAEIVADALRAGGPAPVPVPVRVRADRQRRDR